MIEKDYILRLHYRSIEVYGGSHGVRDEGLLESAIARPFQTFGGDDLYPSAFEKAAALCESLIVNHPFVDGNKRTGFLSIHAILENSGYELNATEEGAYEFTISISTGSISFEQIVAWLQAHTTAI